MLGSRPVASILSPLAHVAFVADAMVLLEAFGLASKEACWGSSSMSSGVETDPSPFMSCAEPLILRH